MTTHVWVVVNSPTDIHLLRQREYVLSSVRISYSRVPGATFVVEPTDGTLDVRVTIAWPDSEGREAGQKEVYARCTPIWNEPTHL